MGFSLKLEHLNPSFSISFIYISHFRENYIQGVIKERFGNNNQNKKLY